VSIIVSTFYWENFKDLAAKTVEINLRQYCQRHGYKFLAMNLGAPPSTNPNEMLILAGRKNTEIALKTLERFPDCEWFFHRDCDSIITNMDMKLEGIVKFFVDADIITGQDQAGLSMGNFLVRNTERAKSYLREILDGIDNHGYEHEQDFMWKNPREFVKAAPNTWLNAYDCEARLEPLDSLQNWQEGCFLVHMAGMNIEQRMSRLDYWMGKVK